jgi:hypothetical protein
VVKLSYAFLHPSKECQKAFKMFKHRMRPMPLLIWCEFYEAERKDLGLTDEQMIEWLDEILPESWEAWKKEMIQKGLISGESCPGR